MLSLQNSPWKTRKSPEKWWTRSHAIHLSTELTAEAEERRSQAMMQDSRNIFLIMMSQRVSYLEAFLPYSHPYLLLPSAPFLFHFLYHLILLSYQLVLLSLLSPIMPLDGVLLFPCTLMHYFDERTLSSILLLKFWLKIRGYLKILSSRWGG
jgi:hypothetical protein